ncbi:hypothetical protein Sjap_008241 [Stephania japonica]|uniref:Pentatricopeptide repeat-containing protein n=1 Tax=Stephania japonica TaxID=461633 RepID=A0AAP0PB60_9MAGN
MCVLGYLDSRGVAMPLDFILALVLRHCREILRDLCRILSCRAHRNVELAEVAASWLFEIEPDNSGNYILLSTIYAAAGRWDDVAKVRTLLRKRGVRKNRGSSWIELDHVVHEFVMGDVSHVDSGNIYVVLNLILGDMQTLGT